jgi:hypothetical protein
MMMKQRLYIIMAVLLLGSLAQHLAAQTPTKQKPTYVKRSYQVDTVKNTDFSLNGQYQFMLSRSKSINGYKLVNPTRLTNVWKSVTDTLKKERAAYKLINDKVAEQDKNIKNLQTEMNGKEDSLTTSIAKVNEISFLGISFEKGTYHLIVWSIILVLGLALMVVMIRSTKNIIEAKHRTQLYDEITAEYQAFKSKSNEQQRKLARELQDERNTIEELKGRG